MNWTFLFFLHTSAVNQSEQQKNKRYNVRQSLVFRVLHCKIVLLLPLEPDVWNKISAPVLFTSK